MANLTDCFPTLQTWHSTRALGYSCSRWWGCHVTHTIYRHKSNTLAASLTTSISCLRPCKQSRNRRKEGKMNIPVHQAYNIGSNGGPVSRENGGLFYCGLFLWALPCKKWLHTYTHTHTTWVGLTLCIFQRPHHAGIDFCSWQHEKRENFMFISLWFYCTPVLLWGKCACCAWHLFTAQGAATVCWWDVCLLS